jgi:hypothetical protein
VTKDNIHYIGDREFQIKIGIFINNYKSLTIFPINKNCADSLRALEILLYHSEVIMALLLFFFPLKISSADVAKIIG